MPTLDPMVDPMVSPADKALHYLKTHGTSIHNALMIARKHAEVKLPDRDEKAYWDHELKALKLARTATET